VAKEVEKLFPEHIASDVSSKFQERLLSKGSEGLAFRSSLIIGLDYHPI
jgi:hypothetical protein